MNNFIITVMVEVQGSGHSATEIREKQKQPPKVFYKKAVLKGNGPFVKKLTFEPLMGFKQNRYGSWTYYKSCYF